MIDQTVKLVSPRGKYVCHVQDDGNLVVYDYTGRAVWWSGVDPNPPPDPPEPPIPPEPEPATLPRLVLSGQMFAQEGGVPFTVIEASDFNLLNRWQHGEDITPVLAQRRDAGFNMLRVWTLYDLPNGIGVFLDIDYARVPAFVALCASYGLYVEFTAYTSTERTSHWDELVAVLQHQPACVLLELVNEGDLPVNAIDFSRYSRPVGLLASHGSGGAENMPVEAFWDYATFHTNGAYEEQRKVGHNAMELSDGPVLTNETSRYPDVGMWTTPLLARRQQLAYDAAAGAALLCAGSCFHSVAGKSSVLWDDAALSVAVAWGRGARSVQLAVQHDPYRHRIDLEGPGILRVYQRGGTAEGIVVIHS